MNTQLYWRRYRESLSLSGWEMETLKTTKAGSFWLEHHDIGTPRDWRNRLMEHWEPLRGGDHSSLLSRGEKHLDTVSSTGLPSSKETWQTGVSATQAHDDHKGSGASATWCETERQNCSAWRRERSREKSYPNTWWRSRGDKVKLSLVVLGERKRGKGQKLKYRKFHVKVRKSILLWEWLSTGASGPERLWSRHPWRLDWTRPWETNSSWPCFEQGDWTRWSPELPSSLGCLEKNHLLPNISELLRRLTHQFTLLLSIPEWSEPRKTEQHT